MANVTVSLPEHLLREARHLAVDEGVSLSRFVALSLEQKVEAVRGFRAVRERQLSLLRSRRRDVPYETPPPRIPACRIAAPGSCLGSKRQAQLAHGSSGMVDSGRGQPALDESRHAIPLHSGLLASSLQGAVPQ